MSQYLLVTHRDFGGQKKNLNPFNSVISAAEVIEVCRKKDFFDVDYLMLNDLKCVPMLLLCSVHDVSFSLL